MLSPKNRRLGLLIGGVVGMITWCITFFTHIPRAWAWGVMIGAATAIFVCLVMMIDNIAQAKRLMEAQSRVDKPIAYLAQITLGDGKRTRRGYVFLTPHNMHFFLWIRRPFLEAHFHRLEMKTQICSQFPYAMKIVPEGDVEGFVFFSDSMKHIIETMKQQGFSVDEVEKDVFVGAPDGE